MCWLAATINGGETFGGVEVGVKGQFFWGIPTDDFTPADLPTGVVTSIGRVSSGYVNSDSHSRMYMVGAWTDNLVFTELLDLCRMGILPPTNQIVNASGAGNAVGVVAGAGPGVSGNFICYIRWWDDRHQRRSGLSGPSPTITLANQTRVWNNLPTTCSDPTVTHIELWVAANGNSPRLAARRDLGTATVTEAVATGALGEASTEDIFRFPRSRYNAMWHDRQFMAGDDRHPNRLYYSPLNDQENYSGIFLVTRKGERITGIQPVGDYLVILCATSSYVVTGYTEEDFKVDVLEPFIGGIAHAANVNVDGWAIIPSQRGWYLCTGTSMHPISTEFQHTWRAALKANIAAYEDAWAVNDVDTNSYKLCVAGQPDVVSQYSFSTNLAAYSSPGFGNGSTYWVIDYTKLLAETGGGFQPPALSFDTKPTREYCAAILRRPRESVGALYTGSTTQPDVVDVALIGGSILKDNSQPGFTGRMAIVFAHDFLNEPGGDLFDAWYFPRSWTFINAPGYSVHAYAGDEEAWRRKSPTTSEAAAAYMYGGSIKKELFRGDNVDDEDDDLHTGGNLTPDDELDPRMVDVWAPETSGRGITYVVAIDNPDADTIVNGYGGTRIPGENDRASIIDPAVSGC